MTALPADGAPRRATATSATARGIGMAAAGIALTALGIGTASPALVLVGAATATATAASAVWLAAGIWVARRRLTHVHRDVRPSTLTAGVPGDVIMTMEGPDALLRGIELREQAAAELTGGTGTRAGIQRSGGSIRLRYRLTPTRRGRWPLGPALARVSDPLGMAWTDRSVGDALDVAVWPQVEDLAASAGELMGAAEQARQGARTPAADDAAVRDYRDGDDLRRIHWRSTARRGELVVRAEEQSGRTAATVVAALPHDEEALEWTLSAAASIALSVLDAGHPVRLVASGDSAVQDGHGRAVDAARAAVLDATVDVQPAPSPTATDLLLAEDVDRLSFSDRDVVVAVLEPLGSTGIAVLEPLGRSGRAWAIVRSSLGTRAHGERTAERLRAAGWIVVVADHAETIREAWDRLLVEGGAA